MAISIFVLRHHESAIKASLAYGGEEVAKCLGYIAQGKFNTDGFLDDIIRLDDIVEKGFERLKADSDLMKITVAP
jgi:hypothetical protein